MCFYDQTRFRCGDAKWGNFRAHCTKEYRTGETCGMKLVNVTTDVRDLCKICDKISIKQRKIEKEVENIRRWRKEGNRKASIRKSEEDIAILEDEIANFQYQRAEKRASLR
jgi:hypothetical protein